MSRVYLDWNATAPLRPEARAAMLAAMDAVGNPSSVHAEGRAAKAIVEKARGQVAQLVGCAPEEVVFTSGATEAAAGVARQGWRAVITSGLEHDAVHNGLSPIAMPVIGETLICFGGATDDAEPGPAFLAHEIWEGLAGPAMIETPPDVLIAMTAGEGETGVVPSSDHFSVLEARVRELRPGLPVRRFSDVAQRLGKAVFRFAGSGLAFAAASAHKLGGPKGVGALIVAADVHSRCWQPGGGQEQGRRSGTENVIGIAGFGAAAEAAGRDLEAGVWERVAKLRDDLEDRLASAAPDLHIFGKDVQRLPNTSCFAIPGWRGETQVMQMDLAGFAVSAGSACSSGKVNKASRVLVAMGFDEITASSAIRVSMGPTTTEAEVSAFADTWIDHYRRRRDRAA